MDYKKRGGKEPEDSIEEMQKWSGGQKAGS